MEHTQEDAYSAEKLLDFYIDLVENNSSKVKAYLADNVVLDWFGKTIKENKKVALFIKDQVCKVTHHITNVIPAENVAFKDTHQVKVPKDDNLVIAVQPLLAEDVSTPPKPVASTSTIEMGQGDGLQNDCNPLMSPPKKIKLGSVDEDEETVEGESEVSCSLKYITAEGTVEFHRPSVKKLQSETKWKRPVKLHLGYTSNSLKDCTIYLIIYEGNLKCRRNLFREFCESESCTKSSF